MGKNPFNEKGREENKRKKQERAKARGKKKFGGRRGVLLFRTSQAGSVMPEPERESFKKEDEEEQSRTRIVEKEKKGKRVTGAEDFPKRKTVANPLQGAMSHIGKEPKQFLGRTQWGGATKT